MTLIYCLYKKIITFVINISSKKMATISFTGSFNLTSTPTFTATDTSNYAGQSIGLADVTGNFTITSPSGVVVYNNTSLLNASCDIDCVSSLNTQQTILLPLISGGTVEQGVYTILYSVWDSNLNVFSYVTNTYTFTFEAPVVEITQTVDCLSPLFTSVDDTDYDVEGITPTITRTHTIYYPNGSTGQGSPVTGSSATLTTSTFYNGTQTTTISTVLVYTFADSLVVNITVTGSEEVLVDCRDICGIYCCIRSIEQQMNDYKTSNRVLYVQYRALFSEIMGYVSLALLAIRCGKSDEVNDLLSTIRTLSNCTSDCSCDGTQPTQVTGLGGLVNNVVIDSCGNGITVTPVEVGNTVTYTVCLSSAFVNLVNSFYNTIVEAGNYITVVDSGIIGTTRTFTVRGRNAQVQSADSSVTVVEKFQTSGVLVVGTMYTIVTYVATDNFINVGAASNASGVTFTATGTTPTSWANGSSLRITGNVNYDLSVAVNSSSYDSTDFNTAFSITANSTNQIVTGCTAVAPSAGVYMVICSVDVSSGGTGSITGALNLAINGGADISDPHVFRNVPTVDTVENVCLVCRATLTNGQQIDLVADNVTTGSAPTTIGTREIVLVKLTN